MEDASVMVDRFLTLAPVAAPIILITVGLLWLGRKSRDGEITILQEILKWLREK